jgi:cytochrome c-type biogenesis protein CcmH/NrfF
LEELEAEVARVMKEVGTGRMGWWRRLLWGVPPLAIIVGVWVVLGNWWRRRKMESEKKKEKAKL